MHYWPVLAGNPPRSYHRALTKPQKNNDMRSSLPLIALVAALATACSTPPASRPISQAGLLKVHPGLLGQPVPPELQPPEAAAPATASAAGTHEGLQTDAVGLRTQRSLYFDLDSATVRAEFDPLLQAHARYLAQHPAALVRVEGNADERGSAEHNRKLGLKRAEAVRAGLIGKGAAEKQIRVLSLGEHKPKLKGHDEESWAENRRADLVYEKED